MLVPKGSRGSSDEMTDVVPVGGAVSLGVNQYLGNDVFIKGTVKSSSEGVLTLNANREDLRGFVAEMKRK